MTSTAIIGTNSTTDLTLRSLPFAQPHHRRRTAVPVSPAEVVGPRFSALKKHTSYLPHRGSVFPGLTGYGKSSGSHYCLGGMRTVYEAAGGDDGLLRLARAWHARVMADEVVSHAFSQGFHPNHSERLAAYWAEALGGRSTYSAAYGDETSVVRIHSGNGSHQEMDRRAVVCFDQALADVGLAEDDGARQVLHDYFVWATTTTMSRYHRSADDVPDGMRIPHWSWDGLVSETGRDVI